MNQTILLTTGDIQRRMQEAEELKQHAKRALVAGTLLDQDFFEVVGDSQESIEGWREFMGGV